MTKKRPVVSKVSIKAYAVVAEAVERGVAAGWRRSAKYSDGSCDPHEDHFCPTIYGEVMSSLDSVLDFGGPADG